MGLTAGAGALIGAGIGAVSGGAQIMAIGKMNKKTRKFQEQMMTRQRDWALADYAMQNEYNSPAAQMARLKEAGLNPNLVYGNGADAQGGVVARTESAQWRPETPDIQGAAQGVLSNYQNVHTAMLQNNLLKTQNTIAEREAQLKEIQAQALQLGILDKRFDLDMKSELKNYNLQFRKKQVETLDQSIMESLTRMSNSTWQGNRESMRLQSDLQSADLQREIMRISANKSKAEIDQIRQNIENAKKTGQWQQMQNDLTEKMSRMNMTSSDPAFWKFLSAIADKLGKSKN